MRIENQLRDELNAIPGRAKQSAEWLVSQQWPQLLGLVRWYAHEEAGSNENWKDAESEWGQVRAGAQQLREALRGLGHMALVIRLDAGVKEPGAFHIASDLLPFTPQESTVFDEQLAALETLAGAAVECSAAMKAECNGSQRGASVGKLRSLWAQLQRLMAGRPKKHQAEVLGIIHRLITGESLSPRWTARGGRAVRSL